MVYGIAGWSAGWAALSKSILDLGMCAQHTQKFWSYCIATATMNYALHANQSLTLNITLRHISVKLRKNVSKKVPQGIRTHNLSFTGHCASHWASEASWQR